MSRAQIAGSLLFLFALVGFVLLLPLLRDQGPEPEVFDTVPEVAVSGSPEPEIVQSGESVLSAANVPAVESDTGIEITLADLSGFQAGDTISLYIPQEDRLYEGPVSEVVTTASGNTVLTGLLGKPEQRQRFVFTVGQYQTFGTIQTAGGRYQLETRGGTGRIISVATINEKLDFSIPDYVIPKREDEPPIPPQE